MPTRTLSVIAKVARGLNEPAVLFDNDLAFVDANAAYAELCGMRLRHLTRDGRHPLDLLRCEREDLRAWAREAMQRRQTLRLAELQAFTVEGRALTLHAAFTPVDDANGDAIGLLVTYRNVTEESRLHEHFRAMLAREQQRAEALETAVEARTKDLLVALEQVTHLSRVDALTGVLNRRSFTEGADRAMRVAERNGRSAGVVLLDLDHFKRINDRYGHLAGDRVLRACADTFARALAPGDILGRFGGEEFVVAVADTDDATVEATAERCRAAIAALPFDSLVPGASGRLTVSAGVACFPRDGQSLDDLLLRADQALYAAKAAGRDCVRRYRPELARLPSKHPEPMRSALVLDATVEGARRLADSVGGGAHVEVATSFSEFLQRCRSERFDVLIAAHEHPAGAGEDALHGTIGVCPEALRVLVIEREDQFAQVTVGLPNAIDLCLLRRDVEQYLHHAVDDGLTRREVSRERLLSVSRRSLGVWSRHVTELRRYLASGDIEFHVQPIVSLEDGSRRAYELLCRPRHPVFTDPLLLVDACLRSGLIWEFGCVVRAAAVDLVRTGRLDGLIFVNLHPAELTDPEFATSLPDDVIPRVVFEINERASVLQVANIHTTITALRARGFRFAIDDLGAGYASLNAVAFVGAEFVKLDRELVQGVAGVSRRFNLARRIVQFANDEGITVVAAGVEDAADAEALRAMGCHLGQGYHFGRPHSVSEWAAGVSDG